MGAPGLGVSTMRVNQSSCDTSVARDRVTGGSAKDSTVQAEAVDDLSSNPAEAADGEAHSTLVVGTGSSTNPRVAQLPGEEAGGAFGPRWCNWTPGSALSWPHGRRGLRRCDDCSTAVLADRTRNKVTRSEQRYERLALVSFLKNQWSSQA